MPAIPPFDVPDWVPQRRNGLSLRDLTEPGLNQGTPRFTALHGDDYVEAGDQLDALLAELADTPDDVAVWNTQDGTLAAIIRRRQAQVFEPATVPNGNGHVQAANGSSPAVPITKPRKPGPRQDVLGHSACSVLVWMGSKGWGRQEAQVVMQWLGVHVVPNTLAVALSAGRHGRGKPAALPPDDVAHLRRLRAEANRV
jgi:hypothetical protein